MHYEVDQNDLVKAVKIKPRIYTRDVVMHIEEAI